MKTILSLRSFVILYALVGTVWSECDYYSEANRYQCNANYSSCSYPGLGKKACRGDGTTDVADTVASLGTKSFVIVGNHLDLYYLFSGGYKSLPGAEAIYFLNTLWAYILEIPNRNRRGSSFFLIKATSCPTVIRLDSQTQGSLTLGNILGSIPYQTIYKVCKQYANEYNCPCNVFTSESPLERGIYYYIYNVDSPVTLSNLITFKFIPLKESITQDYALNIIREKKYCVDATRNGCYVQRGYEKIGSNCSVPPTYKPLGLALYEAGFDPKSLFEDYGLCLLATKTVEIISAYPYNSYFFYPQRFSWIGPPYDFIVACQGYLYLNLAYIINRALWEFC